MQDKPWYKSRGKVGSLLLGVGAATTAIGNVLTGAMSPVEAFQFAYVPVTAAIALFGIRAKQD